MKPCYVFLGSIALVVPFLLQVLHELEVAVITLIISNLAPS